MSYRPREFWEGRLRDQFDLRGTGETGLSLAYNRACYDLRRRVLARALEEAGIEPRGRAVLDVGCGAGFFTDYYLNRGARVTGIDIAPTSVARLRERHPEARFVLADVSETPIDGRFDIVNAFDVLYHITDDSRWEQALHHLARAVAPAGALLVTDTFAESPRAAAHNRMRSLPRYRAVLERDGLAVGRPVPTHVLLNRELGAFRFLNRAPRLLLAADRAMIGLGLGRGPAVTPLLDARAPA
jgi:SAM-dependent methyltransferase